MRYLGKTLRRFLIVCGVFWVLLILGCYKTILNRQVELEKVAAVKSKRAHERITIVCNSEIVELKDRDCVKRFKWLKDNWHKKLCFKQFGIHEKDGNDMMFNCTILKYLKYTERICPHVDNPRNVFAQLMSYKTLDELLVKGTLKSAEYKKDIKILLSKLDQCAEVCLWMKQRIISMEGNFMDGLQNYLSNTENDRKIKDSINQKQRRKLTILLHMGLLKKEYGLNFGLGALSGGPLGELVQWADLMLALHLLGHDVLLSWSPEVLEDIVNPHALVYDTCRKARVVDLVYTDIVGLEQLRSVLGSIYHYRCKLRVLDVYGTEPEHNHPRYHSSNRHGQSWGGKGLNPRQFMTQFPHSPDNSFLGFVVVKGAEVSVDEEDQSEGKALIYGKRPETLIGVNKMKFLNELPNFFTETHATILHKNKQKEDEEPIPEFIINHGPLPQNDFYKLLRKSQVYIGLGWPYEGPAALEAIANGVTFLNPKFSPPKHAYDDKPTNRRLTSQNPYAELIGEPHAFTVDIKNLAKVEEVLKEIRTSRRPKPKVPHEFTSYGFIQRLNAYITNHDFCEGTIQTDVNNGIIWYHDHVMWPDATHMDIKLSMKGESCSETCTRNKMTCEREYFKLINKENEFEKHQLSCSLLKKVGKFEEANINRNMNYKSPTNHIEVECYAPAIDRLHNECLLLTDQLLFSCACTPPSGITRLCPCRKYQHEQIALCVGCN